MFRNFETSEKAEDKEAKLPSWVDVKAPQPSYQSSMRQRMKERTIRPMPLVTKENSARLGRKWYIVGKDERFVREMRASMI